MIIKFYMAIKILGMIAELFEASTKIVVDALICLYRVLLLGEKCRETEG